MTPEQKQFYEKLGDALDYMKDNDYEGIHELVAISSMQKLHDLWTTLCELDEKREVYLKAMNKPAGLRDVPLARYFLSNATEVLGVTISKAVGGGDE